MTAFAVVCRANKRVNYFCVKAIGQKRPKLRLTTQSWIRLIFSKFIFFTAARPSVARPFR